MLDDEDDGCSVSGLKTEKFWPSEEGSKAAKRYKLAQDYWAAFVPPVLDWKAPNDTCGS